MICICKNCKTTFKSEAAFQAHPCCQQPNTPEACIARLQRMLKSGACKKEYFDAEMAKYTEEKTP